MRTYKFKKKDFTLRALAEVLRPGNPVDPYPADWEPLDQPVTILSTFTTIEVRVGK